MMRKHLFAIVALVPAAVRWRAAISSSTRARERTSASHARRPAASIPPRFRPASESATSYRAGAFADPMCCPLLPWAQSVLRSRGWRQRCGRPGEGSARS